MSVILRNRGPSSDATALAVCPYWIDSATSRTRTVRVSADPCVYFIVTRCLSGHQTAAPLVEVHGSDRLYSRRGIATQFLQPVESAFCNSGGTERLRLLW